LYVSDEELAFICSVALSYRAYIKQHFLKGNTMTDAEIVHYYDTHLNLTLKELSLMTGRSVADLKKLIMGS
jgi:hypothetical protein